MGLAEVTKEALYLRNLARSIGVTQTISTVIYCDNQSALALSKNNAKQHDRSKHIDVRFHIVREQTDVTYEHVKSCDNIADLMTKSLDRMRLRHLMDRLRGRVE